MYTYFFAKKTYMIIKILDTYVLTRVFKIRYQKFNC